LSLRRQSRVLSRFGPLLVALLCAAGAPAQDELHVASPDGQIEFHLYIDKPDSQSLFRLCYQVSFHGRPVINPSFLGLDIHNQVPLLGEKVGLISSKTGSGDGYRSLLAEYMQDGSLGRRINVEVRAYNGGVAFRYLVPQSTPLMHVLLDNEDTEFEFAGDAVTDPGRKPVTSISPNSVMGLPFVTDQPGIGWVSINEVPAGTYPRMYLSRSEGKILISRVPQRPNNPDGAWHGVTPLVCPWRVLAIGPTRDSVIHSSVLQKLTE
jgi:alpha-glucosidase